MSPTFTLTPTPKSLPVTYSLTLEIDFSTEGPFTSFSFQPKESIELVERIEALIRSANGTTIGVLKTRISEYATPTSGIGT